MRYSNKLLALAGLMLACGAAGAHSPIPGMGHFNSGMLHPFLVPAHLLSIVAMGLWLGQRWPQDDKALAVLVFAVPTGMAIGSIFPGQPVALIILALTAIMAVAVAAARGTKPAVMAAAAATGVLLGFDSLPDKLIGKPFWLSLAGTWLAIVLSLSLVVAVSEVARRPWMKIGLRVMASWVAAASILVLALSWRVWSSGGHVAAIP